MQVVKISEVKTNPNNPRTIKDDKFAKLVKSIKEFPEMLNLRPIVVNDYMIVLGGNMRLKACKEAGLKEVPIIKASNLTDQQQKEFIIKDNVGFGDWDWDGLANEWDADEITEWGLDIPNFGADEEFTDKEHKDLSDDLKETFEVIIECISEKEQETVFNNMIKDGYKCRVLTL
jgi:ParB-like chromosome segregation protein Spo0J